MTLRWERERVQREIQKRRATLGQGQPANGVRVLLKNRKGPLRFTACGPLGRVELLVLPGENLRGWRTNCVNPKGQYNAKSAILEAMKLSCAHWSNNRASVFTGYELTARLGSGFCSNSTFSASRKSSNAKWCISSSGSIDSQ